MKQILLLFILLILSLANGQGQTTEEPVAEVVETITTSAPEQTTEVVEKGTTEEPNVEVVEKGTTEEPIVMKTAIPTEEPNVEVVEKGTTEEPVVMKTAIPIEGGGKSPVRMELLPYKCGTNYFEGEVVDLYERPLTPLVRTVNHTQPLASIQVKGVDQVGCVLAWSAHNDMNGSMNRVVMYDLENRDGGERFQIVTDAGKLRADETNYRIKETVDSTFEVEVYTERNNSGVVFVAVTTVLLVTSMLIYLRYWRRKHGADKRGVYASVSNTDKNELAVKDLESSLKF